MFGVWGLGLMVSAWYSDGPTGSTAFEKEKIKTILEWRGEGDLPIEGELDEQEEEGEDDD